MQTNIQHDDWLYQKFQDAEFAAEYLNAASEDDDPKTYLAALRKVAEARGGMAHVAQIAGISREMLYRMLSARGNPTIKTLSAVLQGYRTQDCGLPALIHRHPMTTGQLEAHPMTNRPWGPGNNPKTAVWEYLKTHPEFEIDRSIQHKLLITVAPDGYLRRVK